MTKQLKSKPTPTASEALQSVRFDLQFTSFVFHTLCRVITIRTGCEFAHAEKLGESLIASGSIVPASPVGLTQTQTFKLADL